MYICIYFSSPCLSHNESPDYSHASPWPPIGHFFISMAKHALLSYTTVLSSGCVNLYHMLNEIFLQPQLAPCREHNVHLCLWPQCILQREHANSITNFDYIWHSTIQNYPKTTCKISSSYLHTTPKVGEFKCHFQMTKFKNQV